jgi:hypothetical protein
LGDVAAENEVGHVALGTYGSGVAKLREGRLCIWVIQSVHDFENEPLEFLTGLMVAAMYTGTKKVN